ncbi:MAG TPA: GAF domain-containing protein [Saprospiraceae bacterium]|nr:GAF domain-containing protein [Saprospiraceae bacterium]HMQ82043.1 GAF domain-containing protein [Saprospiraceae bacterium]
MSVNTLMIEPSVVIKDAPTLEQNNLEEMMGMFQQHVLPFPTYLSFEPLIREIEKKAQKGKPTEAQVAQFVLDRLEAAPALFEPIVDPSTVEKNREVIDFLMMTVIPPTTGQLQLIKAMPPFNLQPFYTTPALQELFATKSVNYYFNENQFNFNCAMVVNACCLILNQFYDQKIKINNPFSLSIQYPGEALERHFKIAMDISHIQIVKLKPLQTLSQDQINKMLANVFDLELWLKNIPPQNFAFHGFVLGQLIDITDEEALSRLKFSLLESDAVVDPQKIKQLQNHLRTYFELPNLRLGITAIDFPKENAFSHKYKIRFDFLAQKQECLLSPENKNSIYEKACKYREVLLVEDIGKIGHITPIERDLLEEGIRSILVAPLLSKNQKVIGLLEIGAPNAYELNSFLELKFKSIIGLFALAVERSRNEIDNRIEAIVREQYTAIHPSVEWKFVENAYQLLEKREKDPRNAVIDPIIFHDVYPLYGQADIVGSSVKRNHAIQADMIDNLKKVKKVLLRGIRIGGFPLLHQYLMYADQNIAALENEFNSSDESRIVEWLHDEVHPLFWELSARYPDMSDLVTIYFNSLDPELRIVYRERKAYENSVTILNNMVGNYLEEQQKVAQQVIPHYFEKYKTDGVEYDLYVGQSLLNKGTFTPIHLKNLRLSQLIDMCEIARLVKNLQPSLPISLDTAQLVFVYNTPLSIRFRNDEKQFDVDGAYNVRYEILKKRIDKSLIEGTEERLSQAGKIAIVYLNEKERQEYLNYCEFLRYKGYIEDEIEDHLLGKLQGVQGLHALRIAVKYED